MDFRIWFSDAAERWLDEASFEDRVAVLTYLFTLLEKYDGTEQVSMGDEDPTVYAYAGDTDIAVAYVVSPETGKIYVDEIGRP